MTNFEAALVPEPAVIADRLWGKGSLASHKERLGLLELTGFDCSGFGSVLGGADQVAKDSVQSAELRMQLRWLSTIWHRPKRDLRVYGSWPWPTYYVRT